jgi:hypothetical protein
VRNKNAASPSWHNARRCQGAPTSCVEKEGSATTGLRGRLRGALRRLRLVLLPRVGHTLFERQGGGGLGDLPTEKGPTWCAILPSEPVLPSSLPRDSRKERWHLMNNQAQQPASCPECGGARVLIGYGHPEAVLCPQCGRITQYADQQFVAEAFEAVRQEPMRGQARTSAHLVLEGWSV